MSSLRNRVKKAKGLVWSHNPYDPGHYGTWGSDKGNGERYYDVDLSHSMTTVNTPDGKKPMAVLEVICKQNTGLVCDCPGSRHTVCYHGIGALYESFKKSGKLISFFETYEGALQRKFNGKIAKVQSLQGKGFVWAVIKEWPAKREQLIMVLPKPASEDCLTHEDWVGAQEQSIKRQSVLSAKENINLMRDNEGDEGID